MNIISIHNKSFLKKENLNALLIVLFLFSNSLTLPAKYILNSGIPVYIFISMILFLSIFNNRGINYFFIIVSITLISVYFISLFDTAYFSESLIYISEFIKFGILPMYLASSNINFQKLLEYWYTIGILNFLIWISMFLPLKNGEIDYMFFGVSMLYSVTIFVVAFFYLEKNTYVNLTLFIFSFIYMMILGNRAVLISLILLFFVLLLNKGVSKIKIGAAILISTILIYTLYERIIHFLIFLEKYLISININSYFFSKLRFTLEKGIVNASSGRDLIYKDAIELINESNFMPHAVGYYTATTGVVYPHNIILELAINFGFLSFFIIILFLGMFSLLIAITNDKIFRLILSIFFVLSFSRLSFSGSYINEISLWILIGIMLNTRYYINQKVNSV